MGDWSSCKLTLNPLGQNMIKFEYDGPEISYQRTCWKRYRGANASRWNLKIEPFVVQWIVQTKENMHKLRVVKVHMLHWGVVKKKDVVVNSC